MRFLIDPEMPPGRVIVKKGGQQVAVATSTAMPPVISHSLLVGDETYADRDTLFWVRLFIAGEQRHAKMMRDEHKRCRRQRVSQ